MHTLQFTPSGRSPGFRSGTVTVGVDGSPHARSALKWAADEAERRGAALKIMFAESAIPAYPPAWYDPDSSDISAARAIVEDAEGLVATSHPTVLATVEVAEWPPALALTAASSSTDLLVVGARGRTEFKELLLGSVSDQCVQHASCPVAVVHADADSPPLRAPSPRIVVGVDGSLGSTRALWWALAEAALRSASVFGVSAWQYPPIPALTGPIRGYRVVADEVVDAATEDAHHRAPGVPFAACTRVGDPVTALLGECRDGDLLVVGATGHGSFKHTLLGSVAHQCSRHAANDVVVVRYAERTGSTVGRHHPEERG